MRRRDRIFSNLNIVNIQDEAKSSRSVSSDSDTNVNDTTSITFSSDESNTVVSSMTTEEESDWNALRRIFSGGWSNLPDILTGDFGYVPTERMMKRLDKLEDFSENRHYDTKFGSLFVDINDYIHSMSREVVLYSNAIRKDVEQGTDAAAKPGPPKTKLDSIYEVYCKQFKKSEEKQTDFILKPFVLSDKKENNNNGSPSKVIKKRLDNLESSSEIRHFTTKFGTLFVDDTLLQTTREEVFFTKLISGDVTELVLTKSQPSELDNKYYRYLQSKIDIENAAGDEEPSLSVFPRKGKAVTDAFSLGSDWSESTINTTIEEGPEEDESLSSLHSEDWTVFKKDPFLHSEDWAVFKEDISLQSEDWAVFNEDISSGTRTFIAKKHGVEHTFGCNFNRQINNLKPKRKTHFSRLRVKKMASQ